MPSQPQEPRGKDRPLPCEACHYDLRGIPSTVCPECGAPTQFICIEVADPLQYHRARAALEQKALLIRSSDPGGTLGTLNTIYGWSIAGLLWVDANQLDLVQECLDDAGVVSPIGAKPIVDRSEPNCPKCNSILDANGPEVCPACSLRFQWVDVANEPIDPTGETCRFCGYELTGNTTGECPECGGSVAASVWPEIALQDMAETDIKPGQHRNRIRPISLAIFLLFIVPAAVVLAGSAFSVNAEQAGTYQAIGILALSLVLLIDLRKRFARNGGA